MRLKVTRPDEDPAGFQELLEARDLALSMAPGHDSDDDMEVDIGVEVTAPFVSLQHVGDDLLSADRGALEVAKIDLCPRGEPSATPPAGPNIEKLLEEMGSEGDLQARWAPIFDLLEQSSLEDYRFHMWRVLDKLVFDLQRDVPNIPDISTLGIEATPVEERILGEYIGVLRDFENRFRFLKNDTELLEFLDEQEARDLVNALTIAVGRALPDEVDGPSPGRVPPVSRGLVNAAFGDDAAMQTYYERVRKTGRYPLSFSFFALFFPPFFAINYRLYGAALVSAAALVSLIAVLELDAPFLPLALGAHVIIAVGMSLRWRQMRIEALDRKARRLIKRGHDAYTLLQKLRAWGQENMLWRLAILIFVLMAKVGAISNFARFFSEPK
ncbi:hypothetical protein IHQ71_16695 [Rhizobium sp. TH2]|uniref:hypothetical protein n=1 Tax=Rhizobium sp. TH2 TaxID=2775403 RepID=UPI0021589A0B|nr:hypothetical protein [Rhizobium sp. TH2]UVC06885.1 hypothetical protein IHQ71_16695 [Rhizobium sp. TH2]